MNFPPPPPTIKPQDARRMAERASQTLWMAMMDANANYDTSAARELHRLFWREKRAATKVDFSVPMSNHCVPG